MRRTVYFDAEAEAALTALSQGRSVSETIREALLLAAKMAPVLQRLDRIESALASGTVIAAPMGAGAPPTDEAQATADNLMAAFGG